LLLVLPFDPAGYPVAYVGGSYLTALGVLFLAVGLLAAVSLVWPRPTADNAPPLQALRPVPALLLGGVLISTIVSSLLAGRLIYGFPWLLALSGGACVAFALPTWLAVERERRLAGLARALVAGAVAAALVGFGEFRLGSPLEHLLVAFRPAPTTMGPYLRLTSVFHHANIAAVYFEIALCLAVGRLAASIAGLGGAIRWRARLRVALWAAAVNVLALALLFTYCRGALLGLLAAGCVAAVCLAGRLRLRTMLFRSRWPLVLGVNLVLLAGLFLTTSSSIEALRLASDTDSSWYAASYAGSPPAQMRAGSQVVLSVTIVNRSPIAWRPAYAGDYALSFHWLYPSLRIARFDTTLVELSGSLPAGARRTVRIDVAAPPHPGRYLLTWDMLWHRTMWIDLKTGNLSLHSVRVVGPPAPVWEQPGGFVQPGDAAMTYLPLTPAQTRASLWSIAFHAFLRQPLLGGGPHAFREAYRMSTHLALPPPHAHDVLLELLDNWGLVGTFLLAALAGAFWLPLLSTVVRESGRSAWNVALLAAGAAFLAHSTVDYFLGNTSVFVLVCVLSGLALEAGGGGPGPLKRGRSLAR
jgi:hypothetical protein